MAKNIYRTNALGELVHTYEEPVGGKPFLEAGETYVAPPTVGLNEVAILDGNKDKWMVVPDFRGSSYYSELGIKETITSFNVLIPDNAILDTPPNKYYDSYSRGSNEWVFNYTKCRKDLVVSIENQESYNQYNGISINGLVWDTDPSAHIKYTQIVTSISRVDVLNLMNGTSIPFEPIEDFQVNSETYLTLTTEHVNAVWRAVEHHNRNLFKWSRASRDTVATTNNPDTLMQLFSGLVFTAYKYDASGLPITG